MADKTTTSAAEATSAPVSGTSKASTSKGRDDRMRSFDDETERKIKDTKLMDHGEESEAAKGIREAAEAIERDPSLAIPAQMRNVDHDSMPDRNGTGRGGSAVSGISPQVNAENDVRVEGTLPGV